MALWNDFRLILQLLAGEAQKHVKQIQKVIFSHRIQNLTQQQSTRNSQNISPINPFVGDLSANLCGDNIPTTSTMPPNMPDPEERPVEYAVLLAVE